MKPGPGLSRRAALKFVGLAVGTLYGTTATAQSGRRVITLGLDDVDGIVIRHRGRQVFVDPVAVIDALSGKGETIDNLKE